MVFFGKKTRHISKIRCVPCTKGDLESLARGGASTSSEKHYHTELILLDGVTIAASLLCAQLLLLPKLGGSFHWQVAHAQPLLEVGPGC